MQLRDNKNMDKRSEFYGGKLIAEQMAKNEDYITLKPVILINILNYNMLELPEYCTKTVTVADKHREYEIIKEAVEELEELLANEEVRELYEYRLSAQLEENSRLNYAQKEGLRRRNGKAEWKNGRKKEKMEIAKKMKNKGMDIESILSITGLSKTEINNL